MSRTPSFAALVLTGATILVATPTPARAHDQDGHSCGHEMAEMKRAHRSEVDYTVPDVRLVRDDGKTISLPAELDDGRPVVLNFIFTTCTTICPVMSRTFALLQNELGAASARVHMVSISIDPEQDTPAKLASYAKQLHAGPQWQHYTGSLEASIAVQRAFDAYRGDKMDHLPVTFIRPAKGRRWIRLDGFATADELARELRTVVASP